VTFIGIGLQIHNLKLVYIRGFLEFTAIAVSIKLACVYVEKIKNMDSVLEVLVIKALN